MGLNLLIVDDSSNMRMIVKKIVSMSGVEIEHYYEAENGQEGIDMLEAHQVGLVLLDLNMPVMNGFEMIEHVRQTVDFAKLPIIVISTESSQTRIDNLKEQGILFVHKPFTPTRVRETIEQALQGGYHAKN